MLSFPDAVEPDGAVGPEAFDLALAFQFHAELGEECDGGVQVVDDDADVIHPLKGHVRQHNYRLGALGFLADTALASTPGGPSGDYGLMDYLPGDSRHGPFRRKEFKILLLNGPWL
jgi:hypothetical protein